MLVVSSAATDEMKRTCLETGADAVLPKPFDIEQLLAALRRYAPERRLDAV